jgi:glutathione synthase/RimK-type ligase-like ATP-grasp enzyme
MLREMEAVSTERTAMVRLPCADRVGLARLTTMAATGIDLRPRWHELIAKLIAGTIEAGEGLDLSLIAQLLGDKQAGLAIQHEILGSHQLFRSPCSVQQPRLRVLALAAATDMGSNTPIEFLLEESGIELMTLYVIPELELQEPLPDHDIAIVIASDSEDCRDALCKISRAIAHWPRPLLNLPHLVCNLDRDKLHGLLSGIAGLEIPSTTAVTRAQLSELSRSTAAPGDIAADLAFPVIVRPRGSHAGAGLAKIDDPAAIERYLCERQEPEFFVSRFVDYAGDDGLFRKCRIVVVDGRPYACHLAIADRWDIWYLNAGMTLSASKRLEEEIFMRTFDVGFARRHETALAGMIDRVGLDYFTVDCAETKDGSLLIFEADNTAIVHNMDPPDIFPYKAPQMRKVFDAFAAMLERRARPAKVQAA